MTDTTLREKIANMFYEECVDRDRCGDLADRILGLINAPNQEKPAAEWEDGDWFYRDLDPYDADSDADNLLYERVGCGVVDCVHSTAVLGTKWGFVLEGDGGELLARWFDTKDEALAALAKAQNVETSVDE